MKKVLSVLMAGAMVAGMSMSAFAANPADKSIVYDDDGEKNGDVYAKSTIRASYGSDINIDGVVPNAELYIPIGPSMSDITTFSDDNSTPESKDPQAEAYYKKNAETMKKLYEEAEKAETALNKKNAEEKITPSNKLDDWNAVKAAEGDVWYSNANNELVKVSKTATDEPAGVVAYYTQAGKDEYDTALTEEEKDDKTKIMDAIKGNAVDKYNDTAVESYYKDGEFKDFKYQSGTENTGKYTISLNSLTDKDLFKFKVDKDDGSKYVNKIEVIEDKKLGSLDRTAYLKIKLNDSQTTSDLKSTGTVSFKAKKSSTDAKNKLIDGESWESDTEIKINYTLWINNEKIKGSDGEADTGDRVFFDPENNEKNTLIWGDDRAALYFEGNDDASKFYARLQTKADSEIYSVYGDPLNAELWFYDFVGNPTVPSTSRATLTLGIPWDDDDDYTPNPHDCYIYEKDADGNLIDVTSKFTYDEDNDGTTDIEGWTIKTRTLGTYIVSDTELDTTIADDDVTIETPDDNDDASTTDGGKEIPNTGSSDMVGAAVVAAVVSLAAAGAVAFKKASK